MSFLQDQVSDIFQKLEQFLRKAGNLEIFDTLVYNYRLRPELFGPTLDEFTGIFFEFLQALKTVQVIPNPTAAPAKPTKNPNLKSIPKPKEPRLLFHCDLCPGDPELKFFSNVKELNSHKISAHRSIIPSFPCNLCPESFRYSSSLAKHKQRKHRNQEDVYRCEVSGCGTSFPKRISLTNHKLKVHGIEPERKFPCSLCGNCYSTPNSLRTHVHSHHKDQAGQDGQGSTSTSGSAGTLHKCLVCSKEFARKDKLDLHSRTHTGDKPFTCETCGKSFNRKSKLLYHRERLHLGVEKKFKCQIEGCGKAYALSGDLKIHIKKKHFPRECEIPTINGSRKPRSKKSSAKPPPAPNFEAIAPIPEEIKANSNNVTEKFRLPSILAPISIPIPNYYNFDSQSQTSTSAPTENNSSCSNYEESLELDPNSYFNINNYNNDPIPNISNINNYGWPPDEQWNSSRIPNNEPITNINNINHHQHNHHQLHYNFNNLPNYGEIDHNFDNSHSHSQNQQPQHPSQNSFSNNLVNGHNFNIDPIPIPISSENERYISMINSQSQYLNSTRTSDMNMSPTYYNNQY